jgi:lysozyme family protein
MAANSFEPSLAHVLKHEGGYVNHRADPGGATNLGTPPRRWRGRAAIRFPPPMSPR